MSCQLAFNICAEFKDKIHFIPCEIQHNSQANVDKYFESTVKQDEEEKMTASLRGRPLHGQVMNVPSGYTGLLVEETRKAVTEDEEREITATQSFRSFNYWNLDRSPSELDKLPQALKWIDIAKVLHRPIDEDDSQASLKSEVSM